MRKIWIALLVIFALGSFAWAMILYLGIPKIKQTALDECVKKVDSAFKSGLEVQKKSCDSVIGIKDAVITYYHDLSIKPAPKIYRAKKDTVQTEFNLTEIQGIQQKYQKDKDPK